MDISKYIRDTPLESIYAPNKKLWLDAAISAGASHINTAINWLANRETNKANKKINQQQIDFARESFEKEKDYNNWLLGNQKQLQMSDARQAGANPAFAQGSLLGGMSQPPHQAIPNQIPMDYNFDASGISMGVQNALQYMLQKKQVDASTQNLYADTYKKMAETERQKIENQYLGQLMKGQVNMIESNISLNASLKFKNEWEARNFAQNIFESNSRIQKIEQETENLRKQWESLDISQKIDRIELVWRSDRIQAEIRNLESSAGLSRIQAQDILATQIFRIANLDADAQVKLENKLNINADTSNKISMNRVISLNGDQLDFNLKSDKKFKNKERVLGLVNQSTNALKTVVESMDIGYNLGTKVASDVATRGASAVFRGTKK